MLHTMGPPLVNFRLHELLIGTCQTLPLGLDLAIGVQSVQDGSVYWPAGLDFLRPQWHAIPAHRVLGTVLQARIKLLVISCIIAAEKVKDVYDHVA